MPVVGRLDQYASMLCNEFDDYSMSENLLTYSEEFNNASWTKGISSVTANSITSPDGLQSADSLIESGSVPTTHTISKSVSKSASALTYTFSTFAKLKDTRNISINISGFTSGAEVIVSLSTGTIISGPIVSGSYSNGSAIVKPYSNGWYRIILTATTDTFTSINSSINLANGTQTVYGGDGVSGIYIWGAQLEFGSVATDYTPTTITAVNRVMSSTTNTNITELGTYYSSGFDENVGFTTFLPANTAPPYDLVYDEFGGTFFGPGQGRYMRQNTDKSVIVYNEIDEITSFV